MRNNQYDSSNDVTPLHPAHLQLHSIRQLHHF